MNIRIIGCGWLGLPLAKELIKRGNQVFTTTRSAEKCSRLIAQGIKATVLANPLCWTDTEEQDLVLFLLPASSYNAEELKESSLKNYAGRLLFTSTVGVYSDNAGECVETETPIPDSASGKNALLTEEFLSGITQRLTVLRLGGLIGNGRDPGRFFAGKTQLPNGKGVTNLLTFNDALQAVIQVVLNESVTGVFNVCASEHPSRMEFYTRAAVKSGLPLPGFKDELIAAKLVLNHKFCKTFGFVFSSVYNYQ